MGSAMDDLLDIQRPDPVERLFAAKEPAKAWFNRWDLPRIVGDPITGDIIGPGLVRQPRPYKSKDLAETAAHEWIDAHENLGCNCGFGPDLYKGAFEDGKRP